MRISLEINSAHGASDSFVDSVNNARCPALLIDWIYSKLNADVSEAAPLINFDDFLPGFFQLLFVNRLVQFQFDFFAQSLCFHAFGTVDYDLAQDRTRLHGNDYLQSIALRLSKNPNVLNRAGLVESRDILLNHFVGIRLTHPGPHLSENSFPAHSTGACEFHVN